MTDPRTIDNLGLEAHNRWAHDQEYLEPKIVEESPFVSSQTQIDVTTPFFLGAFDALIQGENRDNSWAYFASPQGYHEQSMRLFTFAIIPSIGSLNEALLQRIRNMGKSQNRKRTKRKKGTGEPMQKERKEEGQQNREAKMLLDLFELIDELDQSLNYINARRSQYAKG